MGGIVILASCEDHFIRVQVYWVTSMYLYIDYTRLRCPNCTLCFYDRSFVSHLKSCKASNESLANSGGDSVHTFIVSANVKGILSFIFIKRMIYKLE